jgi:hypothetical protein
MATDYRLYIDESGDHTYKGLTNPHRRYLGLTGVLIRHQAYNPTIPDQLEALKKKFFSYDPDRPPILVRRNLVNKKSSFWVLRDPTVNAQWEADVLAFLGSMPMTIFTVVIDKLTHLQNYPTNTYNPYAYSLAVLLWRVRGFLNYYGGTADIMPEARGNNEDNQLLAEYVNLHVYGSYYGTAAEYQAAFPDANLLFRKKEHNVAGLQIADILAVGRNSKPSRKPVLHCRRQLATSTHK